MSESDYLKLFQLVRSCDVDGLNTFFSTDHDPPIDLNYSNPHTNCTPLVVACNRPSSNLDVIGLLLEKGADASYHIFGGSPPAIVIAVNKGDLEAVKLFIRHGARANLKYSESTVFEIACAKGDVEIVNFLLENHPNLIANTLIDYDTFCQCLLLYSPDIVKLLLDAGANTNFLNYDGKTPLMSVTNTDTAKMLIDNGASIDQQDHSGGYALLYAIQNRYFKVAELLLENGADATLWSDNGISAESYLKNERFMGFNRQLIPKLKSLSEKKVVSRRSQDLDVTLQTPDPGQSSGVSANGNEDSARPSPDDIQGHLQDQDRDHASELTALQSTVHSLQETLASLQKAEKKAEKDLQCTVAKSIFLKNEKKYSIIVYGVSECPEGTSKPDQSSHDFGEVASFLLKADSSIQPQSIKDMHRLGKYDNERPRPRPILVKFLRSTDVSKVLAKRSLIQPPYSVKRYLSKEEQRCESALLKERWSLIQSGTSRESIKIRLKDGVIMVDSKLYGKWDSTKNTLTKLNS